MSQSKFEIAITSILVVAALASTVAVTKRAFFSPDPAAAEAPSVVSDRALMAELHTTGRKFSVGSGPRSILVLSDYECPACLGFHDVVRALEAEYPDRFTAKLVHYPLGYHKFARYSAKLAECSAETGKFADVTSQLFAIQDSLGLVPWSAVLERAGVAGAPDVLRCADAPAADPRHARIDTGLELGARLNIRGTPLVILDDVRYHGPPSLDVMRTWLSSVKQ